MWTILHKKSSNFWFLIVDSLDLAVDEIQFPHSMSSQESLYCRNFQCKNRHKSLTWTKNLISFREGNMSLNSTIKRKKIKTCKSSVSDDHFSKNLHRPRLTSINK